MYTSRLLKSIDIGTEERFAFRQRLDANMLLMDGATGTELHRRGVNISLPLWSARAILDAPDTLRQVHLDYLIAGAELITANTFRTHRRNLQAGGLGARAQELTRRAVEIAQQAIEAAEVRAYVAGSISPLEDSYSPQRTPPDTELSVEHSAMAECLDNCGVDVILVETMNTLREAVAATKSAVITGRPTLVSVVCGSDGRLLSGESISVAAKALAALKPDALLINCAPAPGLHRTLADLRASTSLPIGAYGNVGVREDNGIWIQTDAVQPAAYATYAGRWRRVGAKLIGGCCGTGPAHIAALRNDFPR